MKSLLVSSLALVLALGSVWSEDAKSGVRWLATYDEATGLPTVETLLIDGAPFESSELSFDEGLLVQRKVLNKDGQLLYTDHLSRWPDGRLRRLERDGPLGPVEQVEWNYDAEGQRTSAWSSDASDESQHHEWTFSAAGTTETLLKGQEVLLSRMTEWVAGGSSRETKSEPGLGRVTKREIDARGRVVGEVVTLKDQTLQSRQWTYDEQDRVVTEVTQGRGPVERWSFDYAQEGLTTASLTKAGVLAREEVLQDGEKLEVRVYDRGVLFLVETWKADKLVLQSFYQDGALIRERKP